MKRLEKIMVGLLLSVALMLMVGCPNITGGDNTTGGETPAEGTVATPTISPVSGTFIGSQEITITSSLADAKIYYTLNNTAPTIGSTLYADTFRSGKDVAIDGTLTVRAIAVKDGFADSQEAIVVTFTKKHFPTVLVRAGRFDAGGGTAEHDVTLTKSYYMGETEVTQGQWEAVMGTGAWPGSAPSSNYGVGDNYPMYNVSWYDAVEFCNALSEAEGLEAYYAIDKNTQDTNNTSEYDDIKWLVTASNVEGARLGYRLPTAAEWEYAARGGQHTEDHDLTYAGSNTIGDVAWYHENSGDGGTSTNLKTHAVGTAGTEETRANALGLFDMSGNVFEWCWDWHGNTYPSGFTSADNDPTGAILGSSRVLRGGSYRSSAYYAGVAYRDRLNADSRNFTFGFRVVRSASQ